MSALFGSVLLEQAAFASFCVDYLNTLPAETVPGVILFGHSMGGVVSSLAAITQNGKIKPPPAAAGGAGGGGGAAATSERRFIPTIVTVASPLAAPVVTTDPVLAQIYATLRSVDAVPQKSVLVSIGGGRRDVRCCVQCVCVCVCVCFFFVFFLFFSLIFIYLIFPEREGVRF